MRRVDAQSSLARLVDIPNGHAHHGVPHVKVADVLVKQQASRLETRPANLIRHQLSRGRRNFGGQSLAPRGEIAASLNRD
jgi:hypothetical protein